MLSKLKKNNYEEGSTDENFAMGTFAETTSTSFASIYEKGNWLFIFSLKIFTFSHTKANTGWYEANTGLYDRANIGHVSNTNLFYRLVNLWHFAI